MTKFDYLIYIWQLINLTLRQIQNIVRGTFQIRVPSMIRIWIIACYRIIHRSFYNIC